MFKRQWIGSPLFQMKVCRLWTNNIFLSVRPLGTNFNKAWIKYKDIHLKNIHLKMSSTKWERFSYDLNVLLYIHHLQKIRWLIEYMLALTSSSPAVLITDSHVVVVYGSCSSSLWSLFLFPCLPSMRHSHEYICRNDGNDNTMAAIFMVLAAPYFVTHQRVPTQ